MKLRQGFVSNSSSSSYIIALAKVVDKKKLKSWLKSLTDDDQIKWDVQIVKVKDLPSQAEENNIRAYCVKNSTNVRANRFAYDNDDFVQIDTKGMKRNAEVLIVSIMNDEGDQDFYPNGWSWANGGVPNLNWDIDLDFLPDWQQKLWSELDYEELSGVKDVRQKYGAARNG